MVELANCQATAAKDATTQALNVAWIHGGLRLFFFGVGWGVLCSNCSRVVVLNLRNCHPDPCGNDQI